MIVLIHLFVLGPIVHKNFYLRMGGLQRSLHIRICFIFKYFDVKTDLFLIFKSLFIEIFSETKLVFLIEKITYFLNNYFDKSNSKHFLKIIIL